MHMRMLANVFTVHICVILTTGNTNTVDMVSNVFFIYMYRTPETNFNGAEAFLLHV